MTKEQIEKAVNDYIGYEPEVDEGLEVRMRRDAFRDGAEWRINSVWHDVGEKPVFDGTGKYVRFLVLYEGSECGYILSRGDYDWKDVLDITKIVKWAYVSDLVPETKEKTE